MHTNPCLALSNQQDRIVILKHTAHPPRSRPLAARLLERVLEVSKLSEAI